MTQPEQFVGIDLGTTNSVVSCLDPSGIVTTLPNREGDSLTPSVVYLNGTDVVVGRDAREAAAHQPERTAMAVKREMGEPLYSRAIDGRHFRPETLSALILRKLKLDAERRIGPISRAVITVPAYFDDGRRKATQDAAVIAGFSEVAIINEPTAAAIAFSLKGHLAPSTKTWEIPDQTALVYDLGGGTFDVTVIRIGHQKIDTLATDGAVQLGGTDWDARIVSMLADQFRDRHNVDLELGQRVSATSSAEAAKKLLTRFPSAPVECTANGSNIRLDLSREQFEEMTRDLLFQTEAITNLVLEQAKLGSWDELNRVLLVGGSTRMPMIRDMLHRVTGRDADDSLDPDQVVSHGACIFGAIEWAHQLPIDLSGESLPAKLQAINIVDVNSHSLGVAARHPRSGEMMNATVIPKNSPLPVAGSRVFRRTKTGRATVRVKILEGEAPDADANIQMGECVVTGLASNLPPGAPVQVWLSYETNGRVRVYALDMTGGQLARTEIQRNTGLSASQRARERQFVAGLNIA